MALKRAVVNDTPVETKPAADETQVIDKAQVQEAIEAAKAEASAPQEVEVEVETKGEEVQTEAKAKVEAAATPKDEVEPEQVKAREVAVKSESTGVTARRAGASAEFTSSMEEQGFEGMVLTGMSFDRVRLHEANFLLGSEDVKLGETIDVNIMSTRNIYVVRQHSGQKAEMFYSYDPAGKTKSDGSSAQEVLDKWADDGYGVEGAPLEIKTYTEGMAQLVNRDDEYAGHMISLSIPPASRDRLAGAFAVGQSRFRVGAAELVITCKVGAKVGTGDEAFRPWVFVAKGTM